MTGNCHSDDTPFFKRGYEVVVVLYFISDGDV